MTTKTKAPAIRPAPDYSKWSVSYRGYSIEVKRDFGGRHFVVDGMPCLWGYVVVKDYCNAMSGATWFETVKDAKRAIDVLEITGEGEDFWRVLREIDQAIDATHKAMTFRSEGSPVVDHIILTRLPGLSGAR